MIDGIPLGGLAAVTPAALVSLIVLLLYFERIVPIGRIRSEERNTAYWRDAATAKDKTIANQAEALRYLCEETGLSVVKVMGALQDRAEVPKE